MDNRVFYNPQDLGLFDIGTTQINKLLRFKSTNGVFTPSARIEIHNGRTLVRDYSYPDDMLLAGDNLQGSEKILTLTLQGADYLEYRGRTLTGQCYSFFIDGDLEMTFRLAIK
jgi:hypothetical protein